MAAALPLVNIDAWPYVPFGTPSAHLYTRPPMARPSLSPLNEKAPLGTALAPLYVRVEQLLDGGWFRVDRSFAGLSEAERWCHEQTARAHALGERRLLDPFLRIICESPDEHAPGL
jgi:hypothetical protein